VIIDENYEARLNELAEEYYTSTEHIGLKLVFRVGANAAQARYLPMIEELVEALEFYAKWKARIDIYESQGQKWGQVQHDVDMELQKALTKIKTQLGGEE